MIARRCRYRRRRTVQHRMDGADVRVELGLARHRVVPLETWSRLKRPKG